MLFFHVLFSSGNPLHWIKDTSKQSTCLSHAGSLPKLAFSDLPLFPEWQQNWMRSCFPPSHQVFLKPYQNLAWKEKLFDRPKKKNCNAEERILSLFICSFYMHYFAHDGGLEVSELKWQLIVFKQWSDQLHMLIQVIQQQFSFKKDHPSMYI